MIYELKNEYAQDLLLSEFSLEDNCLDSNFINSLFQSPIAKDITIFNKNNTLQTQAFWIAFKEFHYDAKTHKNNIYKQMHKDMKKHVKEDWSIFEKPCALYTSHYLENKDNTVKYLCIYLSPNKSKNTFDFSGVKSQRYLIESILDILLKSVFLEELTKHTPYSDIHSGQILLKPKIITNTISGYSYRLSYYDHKLNFELNLKRFLFKDDKDITIADDICFNRKAYGNKISAQKLLSSGRKFLSFKNSNIANESLFIVQIALFKKIEAMLSKFNINFENKTFKPQYLTNDFTKFEDIKKANVWFIDNEEIEDSSIYKDVNYLDKIFEDIKITRKKAKCLEDIFSYKMESNIFILLEQKNENEDLTSDNEQYVYELDNLEKKYYNTSLEVFIERNLSELDYEQFLLGIKNFDLYSQVKLYNLYAHSHNLIPIISQGFIIELHNNDTTPDKMKEELKNKAKKSIKELSLKNLLFNKSNINLKISSGLIEILQKTIKNKKELYSYCSLIKIDENKFQLLDRKILNSNSLNSLNLDVCFEDEFQDSDTLIFFDKKQLLKNIKNDKNPSIILRKDALNQQNDPMITIQQSIDNDSSLSPIDKRASNKNNLCYFPYLSQATGQMTTKTPINLETKSAFCIFQIQDNLLKTFIRSSIYSINQQLLKQSRIENIVLKKKNDLFYEDENWNDNLLLLEEYLSTLTLNQLIINSVSKKSILTKFTELIIFN